MTIRQINEDIDKSKALKLVAEAYGEIALIKLKRIRQNVESNRHFLLDISRIYWLIKRVEANLKTPLPKKSKKTISLVLTSNYRFYGSINTELVKFFLVHSSKYRSDRIIIGKTGLETLQAISYFHPYSSFIFKHDLPNPEELRQLVYNLKDYQQVLVYFNRFKSVLSQIPMLVDITQTQSHLNPGVNNQPGLGFILEPEIEKMLDFFDSQIKLLLIDQAFLESELARTASRLISMDQAQNNAVKYIKDEMKLLNNAKKSIENIKLLETFSYLFQEKATNDTN